MNKAILTSFIILCLLSILFLMGCKISVKAGTDVIYVPTADHQTIQEAINHANPGDTIFVRAGIYYEHVNINKSVSLVGEDRDSTIVDGNETDNVISITADNVSIEGFTIQRSGRGLFTSGIYVGEWTTGNNISYNIITANDGTGICLYVCSNNVVSGNTITNNNYGVILYVSNDNVVSGNTITDNDHGVSFWFSRYNTIYRNNFNNTYQVWTDSTNVWDHGDEGNYWSDYNGTDLFSGSYQNETGSDGIGDTVYNIDENNKDNYPLMGMFSDFNITLKGETYHVTTICNSTISNFNFTLGAETGDKIIRFNVTGKDSTVGFCRVTIPTKLMNYPYIVLVDVEEIDPTLLDVSNETYVCLYFTYIPSSHAITIISSLARKLQIDLYNLNVAYYGLLNNYSIFLGNYSQLQGSYQELNNSYYGLLNNYSIFLGNYSQLQGSYQEHLSDYSKNVHTIRNLMDILAATTAIFIITTIYLSKHAHAGKTKIFEDKK